MKKKIGFLLIAVFIVIQFFHPKKNQSTELLASDITKVTTVPDSVLHLLKVACYDCHSNNTVYPWYNNIQPVAWWLNDHINEGKGRLNFSEFGNYPAEKQAKKLKGIARAVKGGGMPLSSYTLIHRDAILDEAQKELIIKWTKSVVVTEVTN